MALAWICGLLAGRWPEAALLSLALLIWADSRLWAPRQAAVALSIFVMGWAVCAHMLPHRPVPPSAQPAWTHAQGGPPRLCGTVDSVQGLPDARLRVLLRRVQPAADASQAPLPGAVAWTWDSPLFRPIEGQRLCVSLPLRSTVGMRNPGLADSGKWWETQGIFWRLWSKEAKGRPRIEPPHASDAVAPGAAARWHANEALVRALGRGQPLDQGQAFIPALIFGDRFHLSARTTDLMARASLIHSLALSGQHLALAGLVSTALICLLGYAYPPLYLRLPRYKLVLLLSFPLALAYLWIGGAPASLLRAFCMLAILTLLLWYNRMAQLADILLAAVACITLFWPLGIFDVGMQLSVLCMATLALMAPALRRLPSPSMTARRRRMWLVLRGAAQLLLASFGIQVALLPVSLLLFGYASPWFALNILWLPVLGMWVMPLAALGTLLATLGADTLAHTALQLATPPCHALLHMLDVLSRHGYMEFPALLRPHWTALPAWGALMLAAALLPGRPALPPTGKRLAIAALALLALGVGLRMAQQESSTLRLRMLDVGQGQALSLHLLHGQHVLVDGGGSNSPRFDPGQALVAPTLAYNARPRLWAVISTHPDSDHLRGLGHILRTFTVDRLFHNNDALRPSTPADLQQLWTDIRRRGQPLHAGTQIALPSPPDKPLWLEVLHPPAGGRFTGNNRSLILRLVQGGHENRGLALLTGDAELPALQWLLASGRDIRAEVLVLPHHGSRHSLLPAFYDAVAPRIALASCGRDNRYGYPATDVATALQQRGIALFTTAADGAVTLRWDDGPASVFTEERGKLR